MSRNVVNPPVQQQSPKQERKDMSTIVRKPRKPRDPNAPRQDRPIYYAYRINRDEPDDMKALVTVRTTRNPGELLRHIGGASGVAYKVLKPNEKGDTLEGKDAEDRQELQSLEEKRAAE